MTGRRLLAGHPRLQNMLLLMAAVVLCLLALEIVVRVIGWGHNVYPLVYFSTEDPDVTLWCYDEHARTVPDYDLRQTHPYTTIRYLNNEGGRRGLKNLPYTEVPLAIEVRRNEDGFRERPVAQLQERRELLLVVGDSFCFGQGVRVQDRFSGLLESRLQAARPDRDLAVVNLCRASADIEKIQEILTEGLERFPRARQVLYVYNLNDPVRDDSLQQQQMYINDLMHLRADNVVKFLPRPMRPLGRSALVRLVLGRLNNQRVTRETIAWYRRLHGDHAGWAATRALMEKMQRQCQERGIEFDMAIFPVLYHLADYPLKDVHRKVKEFCAGRGIRCIDLLPAFTGADTEAMWVHPTDFHPNHLAHRRVADVLATALEEPVAASGNS